MWNSARLVKAASILCWSIVAVCVLWLAFDNLSYGVTMALPQLCTTTPNSKATDALLSCPKANVVWAVPTLTSLTRSQPVGGGQGWRVWSTLQPTDQIYAQDGAWHPRSFFMLVTPIIPAVPVAPTPPPVNFSAITGFEFEHSYDAGVTWDPIQTVLSYTPQAVGHCFRLTPLEGTVKGAPWVACPQP